MEALDNMVERVAVLFADARSPEMAALLLPSLEAMQSNAYLAQQSELEQLRKRRHRGAVCAVAPRSRKSYPERRPTNTVGKTMPQGWNRALLVVALSVSAAIHFKPLAEEQTAAEAEAAKFYIVDCLLPGQVRRLGNTTYMTPRRPIRTTAQDCAIRGGEYHPMGPR